MPETFKEMLNYRRVKGFATPIIFRRSALELDCDAVVKEFVDVFGIEKLSSGQLKWFRGLCVFRIIGYEDDLRPIASIPEIQIFYRTLHWNWPFSYYFLPADFEEMKIFTFACLPSLNVATSTKPGLAAHSVDTESLKSFVHDATDAMLVPWQKAGLPDYALHNRISNIRKLFIRDVTNN